MTSTARKTKAHTTTTPARDVFPWGYDNRAGHRSIGQSFMTTQATGNVIKARLAAGHTGLTIRANI